MACHSKSAKAHDGTCYEWHGEKGPVVVLIHGLGLNRNMWQWQIPALVGRYRVLSFDLFGHGESPMPPSKPELRLFSKQIYHLLNEQKIQRCAVIGFSLGGMIARRFAMDHVDRLRALVILNSPHVREKSAQHKIIDRVEQVQEGGPSATVEAALERWFTDDFRLANSALMDQVRHWILANDPGIYPENYRVLAYGVEEIVSPATMINCPTLVLTCDEDTGQPPKIAYAIAAEIPKAQVAILKGLRHMALVEAPGVVNPILLSFLNDAVTGGADVK